MGLFSRTPKPKKCWFCEAEVPKAELWEHWRTHLRVVEANTGGRGFTFECPQCGPMDSCWGAGEDDERAYMRTASAIEVHLMERHNLLGSQYTNI